MKALRGRRQAAQLALLLLTWHASAQIQPASKAKQTYPATADLPHASNIPLLAFHGPVTTGAEAEVVDISLHVMLKTKRRKDGTFAVRTVSYGERFSLQEGDRFSPIPNQLTIALEHSDEEGNWSPTYFEWLGMLQGEGPFVQEVNISAEHAAKEMRLRVLDWPIYYNVHLPTLAELNPNGPDIVKTGEFTNAVVLGDMRTSNATTGAQVVATHMAHHFSLGFDLYMLYVRGSDLSHAVQANPITAKYISQGKLVIVSLDALQIPMYDDAKLAYDPTKLVAYNHAALMFWGERYRLAVLDSDEMWSAKDASSTIDTWFDACFPGYDVVSVSRVEVVCKDCIAEGLSELEYFQQHWEVAEPTEVLQNFTKVISFHKDPKSIFDPDKVGQVWMHVPFSLAGSKSVSVQVSEDGFDSLQDCMFVVHFPNLFGQRIDNTFTSVDRHHWLAHRHRRRVRSRSNVTTASV